MLRLSRTRQGRIGVQLGWEPKELLKSMTGMKVKLTVRLTIVAWARQARGAPGPMRVQPVEQVVTKTGPLRSMLCLSRTRQGRVGVQLGWEPKELIKSMVGMEVKPTVRLTIVAWPRQAQGAPGPVLVSQLPSG